MRQMMDVNPEQMRCVSHSISSCVLLLNSTMIMTTAIDGIIAAVARRSHDHQSSRVFVSSRRFKGVNHDRSFASKMTIMMGWVRRIQSARWQHQRELCQGSRICGRPHTTIKSSSR
ncbi:unnamed protein product [Mycena citricolor]|uniref:Uncharacterized protein n=1 Tax=Mycena citricolor TaxID=2018698 RepID=A0AAD2HI92_9AGAR|nr:unnamed protein product [Mycena citricolor]